MRPGRLLMVAASLLVGGVVLRAPAIRIGSRAARVGEAREESAYVLGAAAVAFPIPAGATTLRLLLNVDAPGPAGAAPAPQSVRVRLSPDGRDETFPLLPRDGDGAAVFYLDSARRPSRTAMLTLERGLDAGGVLEVSLAGPGQGSGVVRLLNQERRALGTAGRAWVALPAAPGVPRRRVYFGPQPPSSQDAAGTVAAATAIAPGRTIAWTVTGPATLAITVQDGALRGAVRALTALGAATEQALDLPAGASAEVPVGPGLTTLRVSSSSAAAVTLIGPAAAAGALARATPLPTGQSQLRPRLTVVETIRCGGGGAERPVAFSVADRRPGAPLEVDARAVAADGRPAPPVSVGWRFVGGGGRVLAEGRREQPVRLAPEDRIVGSDAWLGEPTAFYLWPPPDASVVELFCDRAVELGVLSPAWLDDRDADGTDDRQERAQAGLGEAVRLRHGPPSLHRRYFAVAPLDRARLAAEGRIDHLALAPRLELVAPPVRVAAESLVPAGEPPRVELLIPDRSSGALPTQVWALPLGRDTTFTSTGGALNVLYAADARDTSASISVSLDGQAVAQSRLFAARGQLTVASPPGDHRLRVDAPAATRVFVNREVPRGARYRRVALYGLPPGRPIHVRVRKLGARHVVGVVLCGRGAVAPDARLAAEIDRGRRGAEAVASRERTALARGVGIVTAPLDHTILLNTDVAPTWVSQPMFLPLGDDLGAGTHDVSIVVRGVSGPVFVRLFGHAGDVGPQGSGSTPIAWDLGT